MPPATEYIWTLIVHLACPATLENADGIREETMFSGTEKGMTDTLVDLRDNGLTIQTSENTWTFYPVITKVEIIRSGL